MKIESRSVSLFFEFGLSLKSHAGQEFVGEAAGPRSLLASGVSKFQGPSRSVSDREDFVAAFFSCIDFVFPVRRDGIQRFA